MIDYAINSIDEVVWFGTDIDIEIRKEVLLLVPHGLFTLESLLAHVNKLGNRIKNDSIKPFVLVYDKILYKFSILGRILIRYKGYIPHILDNSNVIDLMKNNENICLFPGGFVEVIGYTDKKIYIYTGTYSYWIKRCKEYGYDLRIQIVYNGTDFYKQSSLFLEARLFIAGKFKLPLILPYAIGNPKILFARQILYKHNELFDIDIRNRIEDDIMKYHNMDKLIIKDEYNYHIKDFEIIRMTRSSL